jgi:hypothetical protein
MAAGAQVQEDQELHAAAGSYEREQPLWLDDLKYLVSLRVAGERVPSTCTLNLLQSVIEGFDCPTDDHEVSWHAASWRDGFASNPTGREQLDVLAARLPQRPGTNSGWRKITRGDVFAVGEPLQFFLAAMAWGFGPTGYGWRRTLEILTAAGADAIETATRLLQRSYGDGGPEAVWTAFSAGGAAKVDGLGTAFGSKIAYFACYDRRRGAGPLIADRNTAWAFWALEDVWDSRAKAALYARYVATAAEWAAALNSRSDDVERTLS